MEEIYFSTNEEFPPEDFTGIAIWPNGTKAWYVNGKLHRMDGPAVEYPNGYRRRCTSISRYHIRGRPYLEKFFWQHPGVIAAQKPVLHIETFPNKCRVCGQSCRMFNKNVFCSNHKCKTRKQLNKLFRVKNENQNLPTKLQDFKKGP